jgi:transposase-like protein
MELKDQIILEYLNTGCGYRKLQAKYGISPTTICKWVMVHQGIHNLPPIDLQHKHYIGPTA